MQKITQADKEYPFALTNIKNPPKAIYIEGNVNLLNQPSIAIVGSRDCTSYGVKQARYFSKELARNGFCIVSGLARGIDTVVHQEAILQEGKTIAVLGCGLKNIYPPENEILFHQIIKYGGCIVSEYEPEIEVKMSNFPKRNRIISGLSMGTVVIEANYRSGSTITARHAWKQNKKVFCIPHSLESKNSYGVNLLIQEGASLVMKPEEIINILQWKKEKASIKIPKEYQLIYDCIDNTPTALQTISLKTKQSIQEINQGLLMLELEGIVECLPGNQFIRKEK